MTTETLGTALQTMFEQNTPFYKNMPADESFATSYLAELQRLDALKATVKEQYQTICNQLDNQRKHLVYRNGKEFRQAIDALLAEQGGKKKSIDLLTGRAGYRKGKETFVVEDTEAAQTWAIDNCPEACDIKLARKADLHNYYTMTGTMPPGCKVVPASDSFYPAVTLNQLDTERVKALIESEEHDDG